jgi:hypothetical protein
VSPKRVGIDMPVSPSLISRTRASRNRLGVTIVAA